MDEGYVGMLWIKLLKIFNLCVWHDDRGVLDGLLKWGDERMEDS